MLTHIDQVSNMPTMVEVTGKAVTERVASAQSLVQLPEEMKPFLQGKDIVLKKGPLFQTAIVAGTMAVKKTHELIPFCHQVPIESCKFEINIDENLLVKIECTVKTTFKTGIEMEALHGAMTAALTVYDMCKALSHRISILDTKLVTKTGGKRTVLDRPTYGLVLTGGKSERMKRDKALIQYKGVPHAQYIYELLKSYTEEVYLSARPEQWKGTSLETYPTLPDSRNVHGPIAGILAAFERHPDANWIVVACDLVHFNEAAVKGLLAGYDPRKIATAFRNRDKGFPEPLCALYTPAARAVFVNAAAEGIACPVKVLRNAQVQIIEQAEAVNLSNINTVEEFAEFQNEVG